MSSQQYLSQPWPSAVSIRSPGDVFLFFPRVFRYVFDVLLVWQERAETRLRLADLDDRQLLDIGISRADAEREAAKFFWQA